MLRVLSLKVRARRLGRAASLPPSIQVAGGVALLGGLFVVARALLPAGIPNGVALQGVLLGALQALTAAGLVLVYRSTRIINFSQATIGGLAASMAVLATVGWGLDYWEAVAIGLAVAAVTGLVVERFVVRRLEHAPRLVLTVATLGVFEVLGYLELGVPHLSRRVGLLSEFHAPFDLRFTVRPVRFDADAVVALVAVPVVLGALWWVLQRTDVGIAIRAAADSRERATLLGLPVRRLGTLVWVGAALLSGIGSILTAPVLGPQLGVLSGADALLPPLAAAVLAGFESVPLAVLWSVVIGVVQQAVLWSWPRSSVGDVVLFGLVVVGLLVRRRRATRVDDPGLGDYVAVREVRPVPTVLASLPEVRAARVGLVGLALLLACVVPAFVRGGQLELATFVAIFGILAVSLVVLTGWAGQISLGQFALAGVGAATTAVVLVRFHGDFLLALLCSSLIGAAFALGLGLPALRLPGLMLAAATLAFAVPTSTWLLSATTFPWLNPEEVGHPVLFGKFSLASGTVAYETSLACLVVAILLARNFRRSRAGRAAIAVRDNARAAASFGIRPLRAKLTAFALSGALAGLAGGLYVAVLGGSGFAGVDPNDSVLVFAMSVLGGLGTLAGGVLGAIYVESVRYFLPGAGQLLATGAGMLLVLLAFPEGLGGILYRVRDGLLAAVARRRGIDDAFGPAVPARPTSTSDAAAAPLATGPLPDHGTAAASSWSGGGDRPALEVRGLDVDIGRLRILSGASIAVRPGEVLALLGTNGAGKSTLVGAIAGLRAAARGQVVVGGRDLTRAAAAERVRAGVVAMPGGKAVFPSLTVREHVRLARFAARAAGRASCPRVSSAGLLEMLGSRMDLRAGLLSGGEQQMLGLAISLELAPEVLLVDELSLGLAPTVVAELMRVVEDLRARGVAVVVVEQSVNVASAVAHRAVFLERGQLRFEGPTAALAERPDLVRSVFLGDATASAVPDRKSGVEPARSRAVRAATGPPAFAVREVSKRYGGLAALVDVTLEVAPGEILGVIGANGAGKTTLFDVCSGFVRADAGRIELGGIDVTEASPARRSWLGLGRVFQDARSFPSVTAREALCVAHERSLFVRDPLLSLFWTHAASASERDVIERAERLIERFGLERYRDVLVSQLSTGTRRIVELACVVAHRPSVLLLDEPSAGVAQAEAEALGALLLELREQTGAAMVVVEHDVPLVSSVADRLVCMHLGEVIACGSPERVLADPQVVEAFLGVDRRAVKLPAQIAASATFVPVSVKAERS
jgi:branched-chain amino acid transport system permease protein